METRRSGKLRVEVEFDEEGRTHRASPPGVYRARVFLHDELIDSLFVGCPKAMSDNAMSEASVDSIAKAAIHFSVGDRPELDVDVEKDESGALIVRSEGDSLQSDDSIASSTQGETSPIRKRNRRHPRLAV